MYQNKECLFSAIIEEKVILNDFGKIVQTEWKRTEQLRANIKCDIFVIMPNHFHGIIEIIDDDILYNDMGAKDTACRGHYYGYFGS